jgi:hypothetical protein
LARRQALAESAGTTAASSPIRADGDSTIQGAGTLWETTESAETADKHMETTETQK